MCFAAANTEDKSSPKNHAVGANFVSVKPPVARGRLLLAALLVIVPTLARTQTETVIYSFCAQPGCADGYHPQAGLVMDASGNLYGTTYGGGANGKGTVFRVSASGSETVLYNFCSQTDCKDGYHPEASLILDTKGNLYGTAYDGGAHDGGAVFEIAPNGTETVLYSFCSKPGCKDGYYSQSDLVMDASGNLYGTTQFRGANGGGTVFQLTPGGIETALYSFCSQSNCADGARPQAGLIMDAQGNLYGTTYLGGANGKGTVFEVSASGVETVLYSFCSQANCTDGSQPHAELLMDVKGNIYGTTVNGGAQGKGTVFEVSASGVETVLYSFCAQAGCKDGARPEAGLITDSKGNLYGTTYSGGRGTVFELSPGGIESVLHRFSAKGVDGQYPYSRLVMDAKGNLYGTTYAGGANGGGTVFEVTP
jgi:uncharacterized repeat protein (TIGR03803 family)